MMSCLFRFVCLPGSCLPVCCPNYMHLSTQRCCQHPTHLLVVAYFCTLLVCLFVVVIGCCPTSKYTYVLHARFCTTLYASPVHYVSKCCALFCSLFVWLKLMLLLFADLFTCAFLHNTVIVGKGDFASRNQIFWEYFENFEYFSEFSGV